MYVDFLYYYYISMKKGSAVVELPIWKIKGPLKVESLVITYRMNTKLSLNIKN